TEPPCSCSVSIGGPSQGNVGDTLTLTSSAAPPNGSYAWSVDAGATIAPTGNGSTAQLHLANTPGTTSVHVTYHPPGATSSAGTCNSDFTVTVVQQCPVTDSIVEVANDPGSLVPAL